MDLQHGGMFVQSWVGDVNARILAVIAADRRALLRLGLSGTLTGVFLGRRFAGCGCLRGILRIGLCRRLRHLICIQFVLQALAVLLRIRAAGQTEQQHDKRKRQSCQSLHRVPS